MPSILLAALALQAPAAAPTLPVCPSPPATIPAPWAGWNDADPLLGGLAVGRAVDLPAMPVANVRLAVQPSRPLTGSHVATGGFEVKTAGRYAVAAGGAKTKLRPLWLDFAAADGKPLRSAGHGHGPACSSITKVVEFDLQPGKYTFLATGLTGAEPVRVLIVAK